jgi:uncharacterized protein (TIGR00369 family)
VSTEGARAAIEALVAADPWCAYAGVRVAGAPDGEEAHGAPDLILEAAEHHIGNHRTQGIHGGVVAAFLETAGRVQVQAGAGRAVRTLTFTTEFLREAHVGTLTARTHIVRQGRRLAVVRVTAWQDDPGRPVATAHGAFTAVEAAPDAQAGQA